MARLRGDESVDARAERSEQKSLEQRQVRRYSVSRLRANNQQPLIIFLNQLFGRK